MTKIRPVTPAGRYALDSLAGLETLQGLGVTEALKALPELRSCFCTKSADTSVPFHVA